HGVNHDLVALRAKVTTSIDVHGLPVPGEHPGEVHEVDPVAHKIGSQPDEQRIGMKYSGAIGMRLDVRLAQLLLAERLRSGVVLVGLEEMEVPNAMRG